jgi:methionyl aminopeptidase
MVLQSKRDGWTLFTPHGTRAAQFEHTIVVTEKRPIILTLPE